MDDATHVAAHDRNARSALIAERNRLRAQLAAANDYLRLWTSVFEQSAEGVLICDRHKRILTVNAAFERLTGYRARDVIGKTPSVLHSGAQDRAFYMAMWRRLRRTGSWSGEIVNRRKNGDPFIEWLTIKAVYDDRGAVSHYVGIFSDLTDRKTVEAQVRHLAEHDSLTGLPNRVLALRKLQQLIRAARRAGEQVAVLFIDLDRFNHINDSLGHEAGDQLLRQIARRITSVLRHADITARVAADEFVVLLPALLDGNDAALIAGKVLDEVHAPLSLREEELAVSASIGIALFPHDGTDPEDLIRNAAQAMTRVKSERGNGYRFYTRELTERAAERLRTENALRLALERHELLLHYQPQLDLVTGAVVGAEALVRWSRPGEGLLTPAQFIPVAEESGLILAIGHWVIAAAARQIREWNRGGVPPVTVAVNISASQFRQPDFAEQVAREILVNGIDPSSLELELTEGIAVRDVDVTTQTLRRLHALGVRLSLDDFGTGYSSLSYLRRFPIDKIKIDQSFIREMTGQPESIRIVRAIISLAKSFGMKVIAEGVETTQQLLALRAERCDEFQGYLASAPVPAEDFVRFLRGQDESRSSHAA